MRNRSGRRPAGAHSSITTTTTTTIDGSKRGRGRPSSRSSLPLLLPLLLLCLGLAAASTTTTTTAASLHARRRAGAFPAAATAAAFVGQSPFLLRLRQQQQQQQQHRRCSYLTMSSSSSPSSTTLLPHLAAVRARATVVLASKSPRRVEIMGLMGLAPAPGQEDAEIFQVVPSGFPEDLDKKSFPTPAEYAATNAECKAREVAARLFAEQRKKAKGGGGGKERTILVIGSDTIVDRDGTILEKPDDAAHAFAMLASLQGRQHLVHSGVAVFSSRHASSGSDKGDGQGLVPVARFCETARVTFCPLAEEEIWSYVRSGEPMDKAGSYGIQGLGGQMVKGIEGCYFTVMGLPMHRLSAALAGLVQEGLV